MSLNVVGTDKLDANSVITKRHFRSYPLRIRRFHYGWVLWMGGSDSDKFSVSGVKGSQSCVVGKLGKTLLRMLCYRNLVAARLDCVIL